MRVAVSCQEENLDAEVDPKFGRALKFLLVDTDTLSFDVVENKQTLDLPQGAGIQAAQNIIAHRPDAVLTGNCGPKAFRVLQAAGVPVVVGVKGTVREAVRAYMNGQYTAANEANVEGHWV
ncbi:MAG: NifB/NifX family molybdenum-iron cluster-binding protein [Deltaproteobacteria bacterium]